MTGEGRFEIRERLGEGGFGVVYAAFDRELGIPVAMKRLRSRSAEALYRFKREFRALADVTHPNLVSLYELFQERDEWFFTMELVPGKHLLEHLRPDYSGRPEDVTLEMPARARQAGRGPAAPPDLDRLRATFGQLARALHALHGSNLLHRDLKSSNVLVTGEGRVVVLDFGLVIENKPVGVEQGEGLIVGTPHYMSPEQWLGSEVSEASDWYSFGVVLYEALTGILPHEGSPTELSVNRLTGAPPPPRALDAGVPPDLSLLCEELLRLVPSQRPSGAEVIRSLGGDGVAARHGERAARAFVNRTSELAALKNAFADSLKGRAVTVHLTGESGMGKTALFEQFLRTMADSHRAVVLRGRSYAQESLPYKAIDGAIDELSRFLSKLPPAEADPLLPVETGTLLQLFPVLGRVPVIAEARKRRTAMEARGALELRRQAFAELRELFDRLAVARPVIISLDDVHWGDVDSVRLLDAVMRPPDAPPLLLVLSYREEESAGSPFLRELAAVDAEVRERADRRRVSLTQIPQEECEALAATLLARSDVPTHTLSRIAREAGGNPLFVEELARFAHPPDEAPERATPSSEERRVLLKGAIERRLSDLPERWRALLTLVALAGQPLEMEAARVAAGLDALDAGLLHRLRAGHLVRTQRTDGRDHIVLYHDRIRQVVLEAVADEGRAPLHRALAEALIAGGRARPGEIAHHLHGAGEVERAAEFAFTAAEQAAAALAFSDAARLYADVLAWRPGDAARERLLRRKLADALESAGRCDEAAPAWLRAAEGAPAAEAHEARRRAAEQYLMGGLTDDGLRILDAELAAVGLRRPRTPGRALFSLATDVVRLKLRGIGYRERVEADMPAEELRRIDLCISAARNLLMRDPIASQALTARALRLSLRAGEPNRIVEGLAAVGSSLAMAGRADGHRMLSRAREIADRVATPHILGLFALWSAFVDHGEGAFTRSLATWEEAALLLEQCRGVTSELQKAQANAILALQLLGRFGELEKRTERAMTAARATGNRYTEVYARVYSSVLPLAAGDPSAARVRLAEALSRAPAGDHYIHVAALKFEVWCDAYEGRFGDALARLEAAWPSLIASKMMSLALFRVVFCALRGGLALAARTRAAEPRARELLQLAETDARAISRDRQPFAVGQAALLGAGIALARGRRDDAAALCRQARAPFDGVGLELESLFAQRSSALLDGDAGRAAEVDRQLAARGLAHPARFLACQIPALAPLHGDRP